MDRHPQTIETMARQSPENPASRDYHRIEQALRFIEDNYQAQPDLESVARELGLSPHHFQRLFRRWAGISPKRFLQALTVEQAKRALAGSQSVLDASYDAGLSGPGPLHDLFVACEAMTPGEYKRLGAGLAIRFGFHESPFGEALVMHTERGVCGLAFVVDDEAAALADMTRRWPAARFIADPATTRAIAARIFALPDAGGAKAAGPIPLLLKGTNFQIQVWQALLRIPSGHVVSYDQIARAIGRPGAARAVGGAVAANPVSYLVPCHRVIQQSGAIGGYYWGPARKRAMLGWEAARFARPEGAPTDERATA